MKKLASLLVLLLMSVSLTSCGKSAARTGSAQGGADVCLWLIWAKSPALAKQVQSRLQSGSPLAGVARDLQLRHPDLASFNADCLSETLVDPTVLAALQGLKAGEYSAPFPLKDGMAIVMRTTDSYRREGRSLFQKGQYAQAEKELLEDLRLHPSSAMSWHLIAMSRAARNDRAGALGALDQALLLTPREPTSFSDKSTSPTAFDQPEEVLPLYLSALELDPDNPRYMNNLAWLLMRSNREGDLVNKLLGSALRAEPGEAAHWNALGRLYQSKGDHANAVVSFHRAALLDPRSSFYQKRLLLNLMAVEPSRVARLSGSGPAGDSLPQLGQLPLPDFRPKAMATPLAAAAPAPPASAPATAARGAAQAAAEPSARPAQIAEQQPASPPKEQQSPAKDDAGAPPPPPAQPTPAQEGTSPAPGLPPIVDTPSPPVQTAASPGQATTPIAASPPAQAAAPQSPAASPAVEPPSPPPAAPAQAAASPGQAITPSSASPPAQAAAPRQAVEGVLEIPGVRENEALDQYAQEGGAQTAPRRAAEPEGQESDSSRQVAGLSVAEATSEAVQKTPAMAPPPRPLEVFLQVASYRLSRSAQQELEGWMQRGQKATIDRWSKSNQVWYRVLLGPYASYEEAVAAGRDLHKRKLIKEFNVVVF